MAQMEMLRVTLFSVVFIILVRRQMTLTSTVHMRALQAVVCVVITVIVIAS
jgi:hypothetical protein